MKTKELTVTNKLGLHARPCALLSKTANLFKSSVTLNYRDRCVDAKSILGIMTLAMPHGSKFSVIAEGPDEELAIESITELFEKNFGEQD